MLAAVAAVGTEETSLLGEQITEMAEKVLPPSAKEPPQPEPAGTSQEEGDALRTVTEEVRSRPSLVAIMPQLLG